MYGLWVKVGRRAGGKNLPVSGGEWVVGLSGVVWMARRLGVGDERSVYKNKSSKGLKPSSF